MDNPTSPRFPARLKAHPELILITKEPGYETARLSVSKYNLVHWACDLRWRSQAQGTRLFQNIPRNCEIAELIRCEIITKMAPNDSYKFEYDVFSDTTWVFYKKRNQLLKEKSPK